uniref:PARP1-binding protein n=1 Tax=Rhabditophanes sp. KR3021 TaxID=114890 RepID=A0AC35UF22_9BILA
MRVFALIREVLIKNLSTEEKIRLDSNFFDLSTPAAQYWQKFSGKSAAKVLKNVQDMDLLMVELYHLSGPNELTDEQLVVMDNAINGIKRIVPYENILVALLHLSMRVFALIREVLIRNLSTEEKIRLDSNFFDLSTPAAQYWQKFSGKSAAKVLKNVQDMDLLMVELYHLSGPNELTDEQLVAMDNAINGIKRITKLEVCKDVKVSPYLHMLLDHFMPQVQRLRCVSFFSDQCSENIHGYMHRDTNRVAAEICRKGTQECSRYGFANGGIIVAMKQILEYLAIISHLSGPNELTDEQLVVMDNAINGIKRQSMFGEHPWMHAPDTNRVAALEHEEELLFFVLQHTFRQKLFDETPKT